MTRRASPALLLLICGWCGQSASPHHVQDAASGHSAIFGRGGRSIWFLPMLRGRIALRGGSEPAERQATSASPGRCIYQGLGLPSVESEQHGVDGAAATVDAASLLPVHNGTAPLVLRGGFMGQPKPGKGARDDVPRQNIYRQSSHHPPYHPSRHPAAPYARHDSRSAGAVNPAGTRRARHSSVTVRGMVPGVAEQQLVDFFEIAGTVTSIKVLPPNPRFPSGVAYVNFGTVEHATAALRYDGAKPAWNAGHRLRIERQDPMPMPGSSSSDVRGSLRSSSGAAAQDAARSAGAHNWLKLLSRSTGKYYWFNKATNQSSWHVPSQVLAARSASGPSQLLRPSESGYGHTSDGKGSKWGGKAGSDAVGQRFRRLRSTGEWISGLLVQSKQISSDRHVHRAVWDDGRPDEWICLEEHRWLLERDYKKFSAPAASKSSRSVKKVTTSTTESDAPSGARAKRVRPKRVSRRRTTDSEPTESEEPDSFLASSDEVLPQRRAPRAAASSSAARVTDKPGKPRTKKGSGVFPEIDSNESPLKSHYVRGITPPPVFYGDKSWMEVLEEQERARRASVEQIRSARDLPIRLATLFWPRCKKELHAPSSVREALQRLFENGRSLTLPQVNAAKTPCQRWRGLLLPTGYSTQACDSDRSH